ncbi:hypothetical protein MMC28_010755 [Mycoblastus sanguinarius]|nr:hypothetical protein [Mycoblastus sanguinarius]
MELKLCSKHVSETRQASRADAQMWMLLVCAKILSTMTLLPVALPQAALQPTSKVTAITFNQQLCDSVNVTIPNYLGCPQGSSIPTPGATSGSGTASSGSSQGGSLVSNTGSVTAPTTGTIAPGLTIATAAPVAKFTGEALLEGSCTTPQFASVTMNAGGVLEYPWLGCSNHEPSCCPFNPNVGGKLSVCPQDYFTTSGACCPSGWSIYSSTLAGQTPCYTVPPLPLVPPTLTSGASTASVSVIDTQLFSLKYALEPKTSSSLGTGAIAGIAVGGAAGIALVATALLFLFRKRRARAQAAAESESTMVGTESSFGGPLKRGPISHDPNSSHGAVSELPSPTHSPNPEQGTWGSLPTPTSPKVPPAELAVPPSELAGSTFIHEHHPAYTPVEEQRRALPAPLKGVGQGRNESTTDVGSTGFVSPITPTSRK